MTFDDDQSGDGGDGDGGDGDDKLQLVSCVDQLELLNRDIRPGNRLIRIAINIYREQRM